MIQIANPTEPLAELIDQAKIEVARLRESSGSPPETPAIHALWRKYRKFVYKQARRNARESEAYRYNVEDYIAYAYPRFIDAIESYSGEVKFISYLGWHLYKAGIELRSDWTDGGRGELERQNDARMIEKLRSKLGDCPTIEEIQNLTGFSPDRIKRAMQIRHRGEIKLEQVAEASKEENEEIDPQLFRDSLGVIPPGQAIVIARLFGLYGQPEIDATGLARELGASQQSISQRKKRGIKMLRKDLRLEEFYRRRICGN